MLPPVGPNTVSALDVTLKMLLFIELDTVPGPDPIIILEGQGTQVTVLYCIDAEPKDPQ